MLKSVDFLSFLAFFHSPVILKNPEQPFRAEMKKERAGLPQQIFFAHQLHENRPPASGSRILHNIGIVLSGHLNQLAVTIKANRTWIRYIVAGDEEIALRIKGGCISFMQIRLAGDSLQSLILLIFVLSYMSRQSIFGIGYFDAALARDFATFFFMFSTI